MKTTILLANRTNRRGDCVLGLCRLDTVAATSEASSARGVLIGNCERTSLVRHLTQAVRNTPGHVTIVPATYQIANHIAEELWDMGIESWQARCGCSVGLGRPGASVQIAIPEKLFLVGRRVRQGIHQPELIFVVDPDSYLDRRVTWKERQGCRGQNVRRFKATCWATGSRAAILLWTVKEPVSFSPEVLGSIYGLDAWMSLDGRSLRTAAAPLLDAEEEQQAADDPFQTGTAAGMVVAM